MAHVPNLALQGSLDTGAQPRENGPGALGVVIAMANVPNGARDGGTVLDAELECLLKDAANEPPHVGCRQVV